MHIFVCMCVCECLNAPRLSNSDHIFSFLLVAMIFFVSSFFNFHSVVTEPVLGLSLLSIPLFL